MNLVNYGKWGNSMNILIIAPYYAPSSEVPSVRMVSLSSYLIEKGHTVFVLCYSKHTLLKMYKPEELSSKVPDKVKVIEFDLRGKRIPFISDLRDGYHFEEILQNVLNTNKFDVIFTTCGPYFTLRAMYNVCKKKSIPYVLDFRDLGALNYRPRLGTERETSLWWKKIVKNWYVKKIGLREKLAVECAAHVICVSQIDMEKMQHAYNLPFEKYSVATNGFDEKKLMGIIQKNKQEGIIGAVFGKFMYYSKTRATAILNTLNDLQNEGVPIQLMHIGRSYPYIRGAIDNGKLRSEIYNPVGLKEYGEGMALLGSADFFVVEDTSPDDVGTKIYDYIFWNKPIVAAVPKDIPLAKLVRGFEHGYVCEDEHDIKNAIEDIVKNRYQELDSHIDVMKYSRLHQNRKIEKILLDTVEREAR